MSRSFTHLRRLLLGVSCTIVFGFGATQAFAERNGRMVGGYCKYGDSMADGLCQTECGAYDYGYCTSSNECRCSQSPPPPPPPPSA